MYIIVILQEKKSYPEDRWLPLCIKLRKYKNWLPIEFLEEEFF